MASIASPYGLKPVNLIGGQPFAGSVREIKLSTNNTAALFNGDVIQLTSAGNPQALTATITTGTTAGVIGVMTGARFVNPLTKQSMWAQYIPANAITAGYTDVYVYVADDYDVVMQVQGSAAFGTLTNGAAGAVGKNAALGNFSAGSTATGNAAVNLVVGTNGASLAATGTLAVRIIGVVPGTETDAFPELLVSGTKARIPTTSPPASKE
jgi:hypothetical protein